MQPPPTPTQSAHARPPSSSPWRITAPALLALALLGAVGLGGAAHWLWQHTPDAGAVAQAARVVPSRIVAADGTLIYSVGERNAQPVTLSQVSPYLVAALLATEDRRFYQHRGVDPQRLLAAAWSTAQGRLQGGSTLTQQLARNVFPQRVGSDRTLMRKLRELVVALKIELAYGKDEILTLYLNQVPFLYNVTGVEMASRTYFDKPAAALDVHEAALLVAMLKGPAYFDPQRWPQRAQARRDLVLQLMARDGAITADAATQARQQPLSLQMRRHDLDPLHAPHFAQQVRRQAEAWATQRGIDLAREGLTFHTTLDLPLQALAEQAVERQATHLQEQARLAWTGTRADALPFERLWREQPELLQEAARQVAGHDDAGAAMLRALQARTRLEAGLVAMDPRSGAVRAWVGSRNWADDRFDHVAQSRRQPGSTFKPFVYGAALRAGMSPQDQLLDETPHIVLANGQVWSPKDAGGATGELMSLRAGLARSRNTITAQVMQRLGPAPVVRFARDAGIERADLQAVPSLALGTSSVTLLEMVRAYATLASLGVRRQPLLITHVTDRHGQEVDRFDSDPQPALGEDLSVQLVDMLREAVDQGTGRWLRTRFELRNDIAGKTGTTQRNTDAWFIAMQPDLVAGAWVGFNDARITLRGNGWGQGGHSALLLVGDLMREAQRSRLVDPSLRFPVVPAPPPAPRMPQPNAGDGPADSVWTRTQDGAVQSIKEEATSTTLASLHTVADTTR